MHSFDRGLAVAPSNLFGRSMRALGWLSVSLIACVQTVAAQSAEPTTPSTPATAASQPSSTDATSAGAAQPGPSTPPPAAEPVVPPPPAPPPPPAVPVDYGEKVSLDQPKEDTTSLNASAGGSLNTGNTKAYQANVGADFRLIRRPFGLAANAAFAYGRADVVGDNLSTWSETVKNLNAKVRGDLFLTSMDALFLASAFRWDPFAGIARRNQGQVGYARYFLSEEKHRFWGEFGYDLTGDRYTQIAGKAAPDPRSAVVHSARVFIGYDNQLNESVTYITGAEVLFDLQKASDYRFNWDNALRSSLGGSFKLELKLRLAYDHVPAPGATPLDTATLVSILYTLL
jgi:hypothetical protein